MKFYQCNRESFIPALFTPSSPKQSHLVTEKFVIWVSLSEFLENIQLIVSLITEWLVVFSTLNKVAELNTFTSVLQMLILVRQTVIIILWSILTALGFDKMIFETWQNNRLLIPHSTQWCHTMLQLVSLQIVLVFHDFKESNANTKLQTSCNTKLRHNAKNTFNYNYCM